MKTGIFHFHTLPCSTEHIVSIITIRVARTGLRRKMQSRRANPSLQMHENTDQESNKLSLSRDATRLEGRPGSLPTHLSHPLRAVSAGLTVRRSRPYRTFPTTNCLRGKRNRSRGVGRQERR